MSATTADPGARLRAEAARALARIVFDGISLRSAFDARAARNADPRDRALLSATLFESTRWWLRFDAALAGMLERPLPPKAREVRALLVLALVQVEVMAMPSYAVVAACVDAVRLLGQPGLSGLANAVLRRWLREREARLAALDADIATQAAHPRWFIDALRADWPDAWRGMLDANNHAGALTLRVNRRRSTRGALLERLVADGIGAHAHGDLDDAIVLDASTDVSRLPGFTEGHFSVQDGAAQRVAALLDAVDGQRVLDACAAPGGKTAHLLERASLDVVALDADAGRLPRLRENLARLGLSADVREGDAAEPAAWWDGRPFDRILVDAPCSATGIVRRQPDVKLHRRATDIAVLASTQRRLLDALWPLLAPGGKMLYTTCSVLRVENQAVVASFVAGHQDARTATLPDALGESAGGGRQNLPGVGGMDGFFYALVEKAR